MTVSAASFNVPFEALLDRTAYDHARLLSHVPGAIPGSTPQFLPAIPLANASDRFAFINGPFAQQQQSIASAGELIFAIDRPVTGVLLQVHAYLKGEAGHGGVLPGTMPKIWLYHQEPGFTTSGVLVGSATDSSANAAAYEAAHQIIYTPTHTLVADDWYYLVFNGEATGSAVTGLLLAGFVIYWSGV